MAPFLTLKHFYVWPQRKLHADVRNPFNSTPLFYSNICFLSLNIPAGATSRATTSTEAITTTAAIEETSETTTEMTTSSTTESTSPTTTTSTTTTQAGQFVCPPGAPAGNYPYPGDCTKYYSCTSDGRLFINVTFFFYHNTT